MTDGGTVHWIWTDGDPTLSSLYGPWTVPFTLARTSLGGRGLTRRESVVDCLLGSTGVSPAPETFLGSLRLSLSPVVVHLLYFPPIVLCFPITGRDVRLWSPRTCRTRKNVSTFLLSPSGPHLSLPSLGLYVLVRSRDSVTPVLVCHSKMGENNVSSFLLVGFGRVLLTRRVSVWCLRLPRPKKERR